MFKMHMTMYNCHTGKQVDDYDGLDPNGHQWSQGQFGD